jgi:hypothetical protein
MSAASLIPYRSYKLAHLSMLIGVILANTGGVSVDLTRMT